MSFTFLVEDGTGLSGATSLVSLAEADDYFAADASFQATWSGFSDPNKQIRLARASRVLQQKATWRGCKSVETSAFSWPRTGVYDRDGVLIASNVIPVAVKQAVCELVKILEINDITAGQDVDYLKTVKMDVMEITWQDKTGQSTLPSIINDILRGLGSMPSGGPRFVPILKV